MSLIDFGKGPGKKPVERANMPIEAAQPAPQRRTLVDSAKQQRARLARIAESNWLDLEAQLEQALAEVAEWRRRAEVAESENERLLDAKRPRTDGPITTRQDTATRLRQPWPRSPPPRQ